MKKSSATKLQIYVHSCEANIVEVEPDMMESTSTGSSFSYQKYDSLLRPGSLSEDKRSLTPMKITGKKGSLLKSVIVPDRRIPQKSVKLYV